MTQSIVLTIICDDRPGIVQRLSGILEQHDGNWTESSMASLAGKFAGIVKASLPESSANAFLKAVKALESEGIHVIAQRTAGEVRREGVREFNLELVGQDRPGIVHDITTILSRHHVNVQELETECRSASMSGELLFFARARMLVPPGASVDDLRQDLENLANELMVDIDLTS